MALEVLEKQRFPADSSLPVFGLTLRNPVGDLRDLQNRVRFRADTFQFAGSVECFDPLPQIVVGQNSSRNVRRLYDGPLCIPLCSPVPPVVKGFRSAAVFNLRSTLPHFALCD